LDNSWAARRMSSARWTALSGVSAKPGNLFDHWADHIEAILDAAVGGAAHARNGVEFVGIDEHVLVDDTIAHVEANHFADDHGAAPGLVAHFNNVVDDALHIDGRFQHARGFYDIARDGR